MRVAGIDGDDTVVFDETLAHGADPRVLAYDNGWVVRRPVEARLGENDELRLVLRVRPVKPGDPRPRHRKAGRERGLRISKKHPPLVRQRLAAYAVVRSERGLLATEYSDLVTASGRWGMPGGGLDPHEEPADAVLREVVEETGQSVELGELVMVQTSHWVGRSPRGRLEDFHAVRLVYRAECPHPTDPVVHDLGGTTESARWVPLDAWTELAWTQNWREALRKLL